MLLYKYRDWSCEFHQNVLTKNQLYLASPKDLNDPFDCRIRPRFIGRTKEELDKYVDGMIEAHKNDPMGFGMDRDQMMKEFRERVYNTEAYQEEYDSIHFGGQDKYVGFFSLSTKWDSIPMWAYYGNNHQGFCVGFHEIALKESELFGRGGEVHYKEDYPDIVPSNTKDELDSLEMAIVETHTKAKDWFIEDEFRLTKFFYPNAATSEDRTVTIPNKAIAEVIVGINIKEEQRKEILTICIEKGIPVFQCHPVPFKFAIEKVQIG